MLAMRLLAKFDAGNGGLEVGSSPLATAFGRVLCPRIEQRAIGPAESLRISVRMFRWASASPTIRRTSSGARHRRCWRASALTTKTPKITCSFWRGCISPGEEAAQIGSGGIERRPTMSPANGQRAPLSEYAVRAIRRNRDVRSARREKFRLKQHAAFALDKCLRRACRRSLHGPKATASDAAGEIAPVKSPKLQNLLANLAQSSRQRSDVSAPSIQADSY